MALHLLIGLGREPGLAGICLALLLTYGAHAVLWTAAAAWLARRRGLPAAAQHRFWKMALFGPLLSTAIAATIPSRFEHASRELGVVSITPAPATAVASAPAHGSSWQVLGLLCAAAPALGLLRFAVMAVHFRRRLRARTSVHDPRIVRPFERLHARLGLDARLTESPNLACPLVLGMNEVCVPRGSLAAMSDEQIEAVLAHELAHVERRDGVWFPVAGFITSVLWMQPLNPCIAARFRRTAEVACDDRAVALTGDASSLAHALVHVASLGHRPAMIPAIAHAEKALYGRVKRLASGELPAEAAASPVIRYWAPAALASIGLAAAGLSVRASSPRVAHAMNTAQPQPALDAAAISVEMTALLRRERELEDELSRSGAEDPDREAELRHVRATEAWLEQRAVESLSVR